MITWTTRNTVVSMLAAICILAPAILGALDGSGVIHGTWITPLEAAFGGMLVGLVTPGSPVGRVLDLLWPPKAGASAVVTAADVVLAHPAAAEAIAALSQPPAAPRPTRIPPSGGAALLILLACGELYGCGASALSTQARAATIVSIGLGSVGQELGDERTTALDACHDTDCESTTTSAWAPAVAAYESARAAMTTWIDALDVARQAGEPDGDVIGALFVAVSRLAREWNQLAAALRGVGVEVPDLPPAIVALLGAGGAPAS
jgi:hypothetical protein